MSGCLLVCCSCVVWAFGRALGRIQVAHHTLKSVGDVDWQVILHCVGATPTTALEFVEFVLQYKLQEGSLSMPPARKVHISMALCRCGDLPCMLANQK